MVNLLKLRSDGSKYKKKGSRKTKIEYAGTNTRGEKNRIRYGMTYTQTIVGKIWGAVCEGVREGKESTVRKERRSEDRG